MARRRLFIASALVALAVVLFLSFIGTAPDPRATAGLITNRSPDCISIDPESPNYVAKCGSALLRYTYSDFWGEVGIPFAKAEAAEGLFVVVALIGVFSLPRPGFFRRRILVPRMARPLLAIGSAFASLVFAFYSLVNESPWIWLTWQFVEPLGGWHFGFNGFIWFLVACGLAFVYFFPKGLLDAFWNAMLFVAAPLVIFQQMTVYLFDQAEIWLYASLFVNWIKWGAIPLVSNVFVIIVASFFFTWAAIRRKMRISFSSC